MANDNNFAETAMLIRKPIDQVFEAFVNPDITTKFWFTKGSAQLEKGKQIQWTWEMYNVSVDVHVKDLVPNKSILIDWGNRDQTTEVEWQFKVLEPSKTFVSIVNRGFTGSHDDIVSAVRDSTGGFTWVLSGLKAYLEHGIQLNLIADRFPPELGNH